MKRKDNGFVEPKKHKTFNKGLKTVNDENHTMN
jgi:hypothetical protein